MRKHASACFRTLSDPDIALLLRAGALESLSRRLAKKTVPVMKLRWGRAGHPARVILPNVKHVYDIADLRLMVLLRPALSVCHVVDGVGQD
jgi:hypothetical protein